ncbi:putative inactive glycosyltransferase 25 family member 3 [Bagarius yarrelli]|uniref:Putative inactive glycosyltransferase 25 family member 3 n=1 Tax=Bagarius yarrelli TaxID=175774 RepID=A0A556VVQ6_BAGYA|nr:putative inactive glycosyltransferase 25 family member 3 [Bagarius yarrelli]
MRLWVLVCWGLILPRAEGYFSEENYSEESEMQSPTVVIAIISRNSAHSLPYYLGALERLNYPKQRISIWAATDHNIDNSTEILREWLTVMQQYYHYVEWRPMDKPTSYAGEMGPKHWTNGRYEHGYYRRTAEYFPTRNRYRTGCYPVPMVHSTMLLDLRKENTKRLAFYPPHTDYSWPYDDIIVFAFSCKVSERYGYLNVPAKPHQSVEDDRINFVHLYLEALIDGPPMFLSRYVHVPPKQMDLMGFDEGYFRSVCVCVCVCVQIYLINLRRRPDRRERMLWSLYELEIDTKVVDAVDGGALNSSDIKILGVDLLPGYYDPFSGRTLTKGEVGCFLSHYYIWKEMVDMQLDKVLIFEDDVRFQGDFKRRLMRMMEEVERAELDWDIIYLGRKQVNPEEEEPVENVQNLVVAGYSYWTLSYAISLQGAQKLLNAEPVSKMLPVDEFLPIMYDKHPNEDYKSHFLNRNLQAYSASPLLVQPCHYAGDAEWVSDTETSTLWDDDNIPTDWRGSYKTLKGGSPPPGIQSATYRDEL